MHLCLPEAKRLLPLCIGDASRRQRGFCLLEKSLCIAYASWKLLVLILLSHGEKFSKRQKPLDCILKTAGTNFSKKRYVWNPLNFFLILLNINDTFWTPSAPERGFYVFDFVRLYVLLLLLVVVVVVQDTGHVNYWSDLAQIFTEDSPNPEPINKLCRDF